MERIVVDGLARLPSFSHAVVVGDTIYVSGSLGTLPGSMELAEGGTGPETKQTLRNIERILEECGAGLADVVKVSVYLSDIGTFNEMNAVWDAWVAPGSTPCRACVESKLASPQYTVEIMVTAARD